MKLKGTKNGRARALDVLDTMFTNPDKTYPDNRNLEALRVDFQREFSAPKDDGSGGIGPAKFFKEYVMPNLPKAHEMLGEVDFLGKTGAKVFSILCGATTGIVPEEVKVEEKNNVDRSGKQPTSSDDDGAVGG